MSGKQPENEAAEVQPFEEDPNWVEEFEVVGSQLVRFVTGILEDSLVSRVIIRTPGNRTLVDVPITTGILIGGPIAIMAPLFVGAGFMVAMFTRYKILVVRPKQRDDAVISSDVV